MTCQSCGGEATERPALCPACLAERKAHGRAKAAARAAAMAARTCPVCGGRLRPGVTVHPSCSQWRPVPSLPGYDASPDGLIRSRRRSRPSIMKPTLGPCGFPTVTIAGPHGSESRRVGSLVAETFLGPRPAGAEVRRVNGVTTDDRLVNLAYGTLSEVWADHKARARREESDGAPTHCPDGHRYAPLWLGNWGDRVCPECLRHPREEQGTCAECGTVGWVRRRGGPQGHTRPLCGPCRTELRREYNRGYYLSTYGRRKPPVTSCLDCGCGVEQNDGFGAPFLRCDPCRYRAALDNARRYRARQPKAPPRDATCRDCGAAWLLPQGQTGPRPTRCAECRRIAQAEASRRHEEKRR